MRHSCLGLVLCGCLAACSSSVIDFEEAGQLDGSDGFDGSDDSSFDPCAQGAFCDGITGLCKPQALCTPQNVCENALVGIGRKTVTEPITAPICKTSLAARPSFDDGPPRTWKIDGLDRYACVYVPRGSSASSQRPLLIFVHGSGGTAQAAYDTLSLRAKAPTFELGGAGKTGFIFAAHQGRNQENENGNPPASRHDVYYRRYSDPAQNADVHSLDTLIDSLVAEGMVDKQRIYLAGWSNGAFFSQQYAILRWHTPTPNGNRVAAVIAFDGGDPFRTPRINQPECEFQNVPRTPIPILLIHRSCSIVGCDAIQAAAFASSPGYDISAWFVRLRDEIGAGVVNLIVSGAGQEASACATTCNQTTATLNHIRWPDGVADKSGIDYEPRMLEFLRDHPLP